MAPRPIITLPSAGLAISDIDARLYRNAALVSGLGAIALASTARPNDYTLINLPDAQSGGTRLSITWMRDGQGGAYEHGGEGTPPFFILPVRQTGHTKDTLDLRIYKNGIEQSSITWVISEIGNISTPDLKVSGWPIEEDGASWVLAWELGGAIQLIDWIAKFTPASSSTRRRLGMGQWAARIIKQRASRTATLRRTNNLNSQVVLAANVSAGASSITLKASSSRLTGSVVSGSKFTIAGVTGTYTISSDTTDTPTSGQLTISFNPVLTSGASTGAVVTFSQPYSDVLYPVLLRNLTAQDANGGVVEGQQVRIMPFDSSKPAPRENRDFIDGIPIEKVQTIDADDGLAYYRVWIDNGSKTT